MPDWPYANWSISSRSGTSVPAMKAGTDVSCSSDTVRVGSSAKPAGDMSGSASASSPGAAAAAAAVVALPRGARMSHTPLR